MFVFSSEDERAGALRRGFPSDRTCASRDSLSYRGQLHLYLAKLGNNPLGFEPQGMLMSTRRGAGDWSPATGFYRPGEPYIPWRSKERAGHAFLITYRNGEHIYDFSGLPMTIELLRGDDGQSYAPLSAEQPVVLRGGGSEADFEFDAAGICTRWFATKRAMSGYGSKICTAGATNLSAWRCAKDPKKVRLAAGLSSSR